MHEHVCFSEKTIVFLQLLEETCLLVFQEKKKEIRRKGGILEESKLEKKPTTPEVHFDMKDFAGMKV